ncbi:DUF7793 family protein [Arthrobacter globiformis]|uniref:DUF7793 family protein n=1 Tax=Arthrobacter globiformis TaxID=1665 RepID=UPI004038CAE7
MTRKPCQGTQNLVWLSGGVMYLRWRAGAVVEENAIAAMARVSELSLGGAYPLLVDVWGIQKVDYRARRAFAAGPWRVTRVALVAFSAVDRVAVHFYLSRHPPACPARLFESAHEALIWLRGAL